jgi:hypothetical protein
LQDEGAVSSQLSAVREYVVYGARETSCQPEPVVSRYTRYENRRTRNYEIGEAPVIPAITGMTFSGPARVSLANDFLVLRSSFTVVESFDDSGEGEPRPSPLRQRRTICKRNLEHP